MTYVVVYGQHETLVSDPHSLMHSLHSCDLCAWWMSVHCMHTHANAECGCTHMSLARANTTRSHREREWGVQIPTGTPCASITGKCRSPIARNRLYARPTVQPWVLGRVAPSKFCESRKCSEPRAAAQDGNREMITHAYSLFRYTQRTHMASAGTTWWTE